MRNRPSPSPARGISRAARASISVALALAAALPAAARAASHREGRRTPVVRAVERAGPAVVNISAIQLHRRANPFSRYRNPLVDEFFREFFSGAPQTRPERSLGSGVIIRPDGYILTNEHVIARANEIRISLTDKRTFPARLVGADPANDLAVIKIEAKEPLPYLPMGRSEDLMAGETVIAIGNPFGLTHTVTTGVVSAVGRSLREPRKRGERHPSDFIQTDASINPGNSGGPLLNLYGDLVGINTAIFSQAQGIGFAIPIDRARRIVTDLIHFGKVRQGWVGMVLQDLTPRLSQQVGFPSTEGALTAQVIEGSPADRAGLRRGDILLAFGGKEIASREDYLSELAGYTAGSKARVRVWRRGKTVEREIEMAAVPARLADRVAWNWLGIRVGAIRADHLRRYRLLTRQGVLISEVHPHGPAGAIGIRPGDVIRQVNGVNTDEVDSFRGALVRAREFPRVQLLVQRGREGYNVTLEP